MLKGITIAIIVGVAAIGIYYVASPLFYNKIIDEPLPKALNEIQQDLTYEKFVNMVDEQRNALVKKMPQNTIDMIMDEAKKITTNVSEDMQDMITKIAPGSQPSPKFSKLGNFQGLKGHQATGKAEVIMVGDISFLRFEDFEVTNGPDLHVYMTQKGDIDAGIDLGKLKGNKGSQNYELSGINTDVYDTVVIYCQPFHVYFASATLSE
ncbi:MAG TPA: DM13 domain-containing protein [Nitrosopumilaceae archaeon]|nr:DM13 domain-containing protein [Nitrosopumilaceae archaeon]